MSFNLASKLTNKDVNNCFLVVQCIQRLKAERKQLQEKVEALEENLDQCRARNTELTAELSSLQCVRDQLHSKTAECDKLAACNVTLSIPELDVDWIHPWIGLDWIGLDWIGSKF